MQIDINVRSGRVHKKENTMAVVKQITDFITQEMRLKIVKVKAFNDRPDNLHTFIIADEL
jgi:hypothetical protein